MADPPPEFAFLMQRVRQHSNGAARELLQQYGAVILRVVRRHLNKQLRSKFDSQDFLQSVWASFFALPPDRLVFDRPEALGAFLAHIARNKVIDRVRQRLQTLKYDVQRESSLEGLHGPGADALVGREPTPPEIAIAHEEWERLLAHRPARHQEILHSLRAGKSPRQIAEDLGLHEDSIRRVVRRLKPGVSHE